MDLPRRAQHRTIATENEQQVHLTREGGWVWKDRGLDPGGRRRGRISEHLSVGSAKQTDSLTNSFAAGDHLRMANQSDAFDPVTWIFQSAPKTLCYPPGRAAAIL